LVLRLITDAPKGERGRSKGGDKREAGDKGKGRRHGTQSTNTTSPKEKEPTNTQKNREREKKDAKGKKNRQKKG